MKIRNSIIVLAVGIIMLYFSGCAPKAVVKVPKTIISDQVIDVSDDELNEWKKLAKNGTNSEDRSKGAFWSGQYYFNKKDYDKALKYFAHNEKYYTDTTWGYMSIVRMVDIYELNKDEENAYNKFKILLEKRHQFPNFKDYILSRLEKKLEVKTTDDLKILYKKHYHPFIDEYALYLICKADLRENKYDDFANHAKAFLMEYRDSVFHEEIAVEFRKAVKYKPVNKNKIGVIMPLSGNAMGIALNIKNGIELALSEYNEDKTEEDKIVAVYIDEAQSVSSLTSDIVKVIDEENVIAFIGPLFSKTVENVLPVISSYNIIMFSPTAAGPGLPEKSPYFFRNCGTAKGQSYAMARHIKEKTQVQNIGTIYPDNLLGETMNNAFVERMQQFGKNIVRSVAYDPGKNDFKKQMILLGGIDTILFKEKRAKEKRKITDMMKDSGERILAKIFDYMNLYQDVNVEKQEDLPKITISLLRFAERGENIEKYEITDDLTNKLSYAIAKHERVKVHKQSLTNKAMEDSGVSPEDLDREMALNVAYGMNSDILIWSRIAEEQSNTIYANFLPDEVVDDKGTTRVVYNFKDEDYFYYNITISAFSVADEELIDEIYFRYKKVKEPAMNPLGLDALYIPAPDKKLVLIKDQLKFYDLDLPVFAGSNVSGKYLLNFRENVNGLVYLSEFLENIKDENVQLFLEKYREKYAATPNVIAANSYDLMRIVSAIMERGIESRENFKDMLKGVRNYEGVTGRFSFDMYGDSVKYYYVMQIDGRERLLNKVRGY